MSSVFVERSSSKQSASQPSTILTVGHSTRFLDDFISILRAHGVERLVDIRTVPRSRTNPQFNRETLPGALSTAGIRYVHMPNLGGLRHARPDSPHTAWRNASFRGYADYMETPEFEAGIEALLKLERTSRIVLMCAEAVPWRCHRSLLADALTARGVRVEHIMNRTRRDLHHLTPFARVEGAKVSYRGKDPAQGELPLADPRRQE